MSALSDYEDTIHEERPDTPVTAAAYAMSSVYVKGADARETSKVAKMLAVWISSHLPASSGSSQDDSQMLFKFLTSDQPPAPRRRTPSRPSGLGLQGFGGPTHDANPHAHVSLSRADRGKNTSTST